MATGSTEFVCRGCGKGFTRVPQFKLARPKYCSVHCSTDDLRADYVHRSNRAVENAKAINEMRRHETATTLKRRAYLPLHPDPAERTVPSCLADPDCKRPVVTDGMCARHAALEAFV